MIFVIELLSLSSIILIALFIVCTVFFIIVYLNVSKYLEKRYFAKKDVEMYSIQQGLDSQTIERLKSKLIDEGEMRNLEDIIYRLKVLRKEAEEILEDAGRSEES